MMRAMQIWLVSIGVALVAMMASAQTDAGNGVARVSLVRGDVTVQRGDSGELTEAAINAPLVTGDRLLTGPGSRTELQFDYAHFLRLAPNSEVRMLELRPERYLVAVAEGTVAFSRIDQFDSEVEVNTPSVSVRPVQRGNFRVSVYPDGTSEITVREGQVEVYTPEGVERLGPGRTMMARGDMNNPEFQYVQQARRDEFDNWNRDRDRLIRRSESYRYVDRSIPGAYELDAYGSWVNVAPYGMVWRPRVAGGWAPYRHGRWAWVDYWGWNWVSYDPWGWAPFHYGRWFNSPGVGWCWYPGGFSRHFYSPAVVGWFGFGNVGVGFGFGNVGWVPLAPFEPFYPWWGGRWGGWHGGGWRNNRTFIDNSVTIVNNTNITNVYRNARVNNGYTVVDGQNFARGASVRHNGAGVDSLRTASAVRGQIPVTPDRGSLRFTDRAVDRAQYEGRLSRTEGRQFHTRTQPTRVDRASFETQRGAMEQVQRQAFSRGASAEGSVNRQSARGDGAAVGGDPGSRGATRGVATQPAQEMGRGASASAGGEAATSRGASSRGQSADLPGRGDAGMVRGSQDASATQDRGGWRRFGEPVTRQGTDRGATTSRGGSAGAERTGSVDSGRGASRGEATPNTDSGSSWRRFGEPAGRTGGESGRGVEAPARSASPSDGFGRGGGTARGTESTRGAEATRTAPAPRGDSGADRGGWQSFGRSGSGAAAERGSATRGASAGRSQESAPAPSMQRSTTRGDSGSSRGGYEGGSTRGASPQQLNVSPPIVRERGGSTAAPSSGGRGSGSSPGATSTGRGTTNRSSMDSSGWRRFEGGAASSGVQVYGSSRGSTSPSTYRSPAAGRSSSGASAQGSWRSFSGGGSQSTGRSATDAYAGSSRGSSNSGYNRATTPSSRGSYSRSSGSYGAGSGGSGGGSYGTYRSPAPSYGGSSAGRSGGTYSQPSGSYSRSGGSYGGSVGRSSGSYGGGSIRGGGGGSYGGSVSRGGGSYGGGSMRGGGGGSSMGGRSGGGMSSGGGRGGGRN